MARRMVLAVIWGSAFASSVRFYIALEEGTNDGPALLAPTLLFPPDDENVVTASTSMN
jgi:hypothetical protein